MAWVVGRASRPTTHDPPTHPRQLVNLHHVREEFQKRNGKIGKQT